LKGHVIIREGNVKTRRRLKEGKGQSCVGVLDVKTTSVLGMKSCVCDSVLEKVHANLWFKQRVGLLEMSTVITLIRSKWIENV
jgi:hypothetical protein